MKNKKNNTKLLLIGSRTKINPDAIIAFKASINYSYVYLTSGRVLLTSTHLGLIESRVNKDEFIRTHRSTILNISHVKSFDENFPTEVEMKNNLKLFISRRKRQNFITHFNNFKISNNIK